MLQHLVTRMREGKMRNGAVAYVLFDTKWHDDVASWRALKRHAEWSTQVSIDEQSLCLSMLKESDYERRYCHRAKGTFIVASISVAKYAVAMNASAA